jgi:hypothetical protein
VVELTIAGEPDASLNFESCAQTAIGFAKQHAHRAGEDGDEQLTVARVGRNGNRRLARVQHCR